MRPTAIGRCPACGATRLEETHDGAIVCGFCGARMDRELRPLPPIQVAPGVPRASPLSEEIPTSTHLPRLVRQDGDEDLATQPRISGAPPVAVPRLSPAPVPGVMPALGPQKSSMPAPSAGPAPMPAPTPVPAPEPERPSRSLFAPPPALGPFAPPPSKDAFERDAGRRPWARPRGDGGPPVGLDTLVLVLAGVAVLSAGLWWRSRAPVAGAFLVPLLGSLLVLYFFWQGKNWARFLILLGALVEVVGIALAYALVRRALTWPEKIALGFRLVLDVWIISFSLRPDVVAYFERRSGKPKR